jgi:hypothetical protein
VPSYGQFGDVPIAVNVNGPNIEVNGPDWVLKKAQELGQVDDWLGIVDTVATNELARGSR